MADYEILVKTFLRFPCVKRLIRSIRTYYPDITIRICDDGNGEEIKGERIIYHRLPYYSGLAVGKNFLVQKCETPYFITMDDDFIVIKETDLNKLHKIISSSDNIAIASGRIKEFNKDMEEYIRYGAGHLEVTYSEKEGRKITRYYYGDNAPKETVNEIECIPCRITPQLIMGNKALWRKYNIKWRDELKRAEHLPFFLDLPLQVKCYVVPEVMIGHMPFKSKEYAKYKDNNIYHKMIYERKISYKVLYQ